MESYREFIRQVILPHVDVTRCGRLVYQAEPTLRVSLPGARAPGGRARRAADYFHQPGELAFFVPLTSTHGSNGMHVAFEPGADAEIWPLRVTCGQCLHQASVQAT